MQLQESGEMYLETILLLSRDLEKVRAVDICERLGYSKPSVSRAMSILRNAFYISIDKNGSITLTNSGHEIAEKIYDRHQVLTRALMLYGIDEKTATEDACRIEHVISDISIEKIKESIQYE